MLVPRERAAAATLPNGEVLVAGGENEGGQLKTAELYDPASNSWTVIAEMNEPREGPAAAALADGDVLVAGGLREEEYAPGLFSTYTLASAEIYDPATNAWTAVASMNTARKGAVAATLPDGEALVAGGNEGGSGLVATETYDALTNEWHDVGALPEGSDFAAATTLPDGEVLLTGGKSESSYEPFSSTYIFNPSSETWRAVAPLTVARDFVVAAGLPDGTVLVDTGHGSEHGRPGYLLSSEAYDSSANSWSADTPPLVAREGAIAASLPDGAVLVAGGEGAEGDDEYLETAELFYSAPEAQVAGGALGGEPVGSQSQAAVVTVTNVGAQALSITGASVVGPDSGDFAITADACPQRQVPLGQSCAITVRFTPTATGARTANISLTDNEASATAIPLSGTGVLQSSGAGGTTGAAGVAGQSGSPGAAGPAGASGPAGPAAKLELITCTTATGARSAHGEALQTCRARPTRATVTIAMAGVRVTAVLARGGLIYAKGVGIESRRATEALLAPRRSIGKGTYTLTLGRGRNIRRETLTIG